ncbi:LptE family protein [Mucilaginibacter sp. ZT4R22]|uniref:LptE family protein n=1 Tax=Mucilaginibacter pankratovii TaxID=2772110 RepID=A0ABR7WTG9_9SPHI|nr:LptE family protein [Mucilaginibacter pankratovii]MBD1365604.1 LptE family protein [Mucilaginibacter pankratovii]
MTKKLFLSTVMLGAVICLFNSCSVSLISATIPPELKTINIQYFENTAPLVINTLSQDFTEALKNRIRTQTNLSIVRGGEADAMMSGAITGYSYAPISVQATNNNTAPIAGASRLTITVSVKFTYKKLSFDESFTKSKDFTGDISSQEQQLIQDINKQLTDDIFNKAFNNW